MNRELPRSLQLKDTKFDAWMTAVVKFHKLRKEEHLPWYEPIHRFLPDLTTQVLTCRLEIIVQLLYIDYHGASLL